MGKLVHTSFQLDLQWCLREHHGDHCQSLCRAIDVHQLGVGEVHTIIFCGISSIQLLMDHGELGHRNQRMDSSTKVSAYDAYQSEENKVGVPSGVFSLLAL